MPIADDWSINYTTKQIYQHNWKDEIGAANTSIAEIQTVLCLAFASISGGDYFNLYSAKDETPYYVWFTKDGAGTDPAPTGKTAILVALVAADDLDTEVATKVATAIQAINSGKDFTAASSGTATVTITNVNKGSCTDASDSTGGTATAFTFGVTTSGKGETVFSVNALYSYLQDTFDELGQMDDKVPMSAQTPTDYTIINEWFIDEVSTKYLTGGALKTDGWLRNDDNAVGTDNNGIVQIIYDSGTPVSTDIGLPVVEETDGDTGTCLFIDTTRSLIWIRPGSVAIANSFDSTSGHNVDFTGGTQNISRSADIATSGENLWANVYTLGTIESVPYPQIYIFQNGSAISEWSTLTNWDRGHIDVLVRVKEMGTEIDGASITVFARQGNDAYDHFTIDLTSGGRNAVPLSTATDLNYTTGDYYLLYDAEVDGPGSTALTAGEIIKQTVSLNGAYTSGGWEAEVVSNTVSTTTGLLKLTNVTGTITDNQFLKGKTSLAYAQVVGKPGDTYFAYAEGTTFSTLDQVITQATSGTKRILRSFIDDGATGRAVSQVDTSVAGALRNVYYKDFNATNLVTGATDGSVTPSATSTTIVSGWSDITVAFVNGTITYSATSGALTPGEKVTQATSGATGIFLYQTTTTGAGTATLGNVVGTFNNTNLVTGAISTNTFTSSGTLSSANTMNKNFDQQGSLYPSDVYDVIINAGDIYNAGRTMAQVYQYLKLITQQNATFQMYTVVSGTITPLDGEEYIQAYTGYTPVKSAPFGTFAGGTFFGAQSVWVEGLASGQSYSFITSAGVTRQPYASITISVSSVVALDRVTVFITTGGLVEKNMYQSHASNNSAGDLTVETDGTPDIATDTPVSGVLRIVDTSENTEHRYRYASWTTDAFTLVNLSALDGTANTADVTGTTLYADAATYDNVVLPGDLVRNTTTNAWAHVITVDDTNNIITHTPLQGGTANDNDWAVTDGYSFNSLAVTYGSSDTIYVPFIDQTATDTSVSKTVLYDANKSVLVRVRKKGILPFETSGTVTSSGLSVAAIRTTDSIVT